MHYEKFADGSVKCIEGEIPFELPEGWSWARLQSITSILTDGTHKTPQYSDDGYIFLSSKNVTSGKIDWDNIMYIPEALHQELYNRLAPRVGDILLAKNGTTGIAAIVDREDVFDIYVSLALIRIVDHIINPLYVLRAIGSSYIQDYFNSSLKGIGVPNLHLEHIRKALIPIPPCAEQGRIILKANMLLPLVEKIANDETELHHLVSKAKSKILDLAIRGQLVSQNPDDEPASVLLERIRAEKEELIKQGKIKRDKKESFIFKGEDNSYFEKIGNDTFDITHSIPFKIPNTWTWCRLKCITSNEDNSFVDGPFGSDLKTIHYTEKEEVRIVQLNNIGEKGWRDAVKKYTTFSHAKNIERCISFPGDIVIAKMMPAGRAIILPSVNSMYVISSDCIRLRADYRLNKEYLMFMLNSPSINKCVLDTVQGIGRTRTSLNKMKDILIPVPPESEQIKISKILTMCFEYLTTISASL